MSEPKPSPRRVIESSTRPILPTPVVAAVVALEAAKGSTLHESRCSRGPNLQVVFCVADESSRTIEPRRCSLPYHDEVPIPDWYMPPANASQEQTMENDSVESY